MRTLVMGDIHGAYKALQQCLERSGFDQENDLLIQLGDVVDGYPQVYECVEELLKIKHLVALKGNHDDWFNEFARTDFHPYFWNLGGRGTLVSYLEHAGKKGRFFSSGSGYKLPLTQTISLYRIKTSSGTRCPITLTRKKGALSMRVLTVNSRFTISESKITIGTGSYGTKSGNTISRAILRKGLPSKPILKKYLSAIRLLQNLGQTNRCLRFTSPILTPGQAIQAV